MLLRSLTDVRRWAQEHTLGDGKKVIDHEWVQLHLARAHAKIAVSYTHLHNHLPTPVSRGARSDQRNGARRTTPPPQRRVNARPIVAAAAPTQVRDPDLPAPPDLLRWRHDLDAQAETDSQAA